MLTGPTISPEEVAKAREENLRHSQTSSETLRLTAGASQHNG